jgi:UDP-glucose 4-epimerase
MSATNRVAVVTGAAGYLGSHTTEGLLKRGYAVRAIDLPSGPFEANLGGSLGHSSLTVDRRDLMAIPADDRIFRGADYLFHCAGRADHTAAAAEPETFMRANVLAVAHALEAARVNGMKKFVYPSSAAVYGTAAWPTREDHPIAYGNLYGMTKWMGEVVVGNWHRFLGVPSLSFRVFNGYGPRMTPAGGVVGAFLKRLVERKPVVILGDGGAQRDFVYITDIVEAFVRGAESDRTGEIYNLASGKTRTVKELATLLGCAIEYGPPRAGEPPVICADVSKIRDHLGWEAKVGLEEGVAALLAATRR